MNFEKPLRVLRLLVRALLARPEGLLAVTFGGLILAGALALSLPMCHGRQRVGFLDALFTSTSAVCVTGLITVDTGTAWSRTGQTVILVLIQLGGLGIMTFAALAAQLLRLRLSFSSHAAWQGALFEREVRGDLKRALGAIVASTVLIEAIGAAFIFIGLRRAEIPGGWYEAVFHAISAFCNAGFSVYSDNAVALRNSPLVLGTLMVLIICGGLGYMVLLEVLERFRRLFNPQRAGRVRWSLHTRVALKMTALLIFGGAALLVLLGLDLAPGESHWGRRAAHALFQSVSARTAGFNTLDIGALPLSSLLLLVGLMFIGGSPGSAAGGVKTTTTAVWLARVRAQLMGRESVLLGQRRVAPEVVRRATFVLGLAGLWNLVGLMILAVCEGDRPGVRFEQLLFEQVSAFGTVGLSAHPGTTVSLSGVFTGLGKLWIAATMFIGRVGPLTLALAVIPVHRPTYQYPQERVMIG